jgi:rubrerythrin
MKLTKTQLKEMIKTEMKSLKEASTMEKASGNFYKKTKELVKKGELSADVAKVLESLFDSAVWAAFSDGARGGFRR